MKKTESVEKEALEFLDDTNAGLAAAATRAAAEFEKAAFARLTRAGSGNFAVGFSDYLRVGSMRAGEAARRRHLCVHGTEIIDACAKIFAAKTSSWPKRRDEIGDEIAAIVKAQALGRPTAPEAEQFEKRLCALEAELESGDERFSAGSNLIEAFRAAGQTEIESCYRQLAAFARETISELAEAA